jgi:hypothetical protein
MTVEAINGSHRLVRNVGGRWVVALDKLIKPDGAKQSRRIRVRKKMPIGFTEQQAVAAAAKMEADLIARALAVNGVDDWAEYVDGLYANRRSWLHVMVAKCKGRAKDGHLFQLTAERLREVMLRSKGRCEVTGLRFQLKGAEAARQRPFFHSLDRIDSSRGYEATNMRLVCFAANAAMNQWGEAIFGEIACGYVFNKYSAFQVLTGR